MEEPITFTMPSVRMRRSLHRRSAARESAVSPDWVMVTTSVFGFGTEVR